MVRIMKKDGNRLEGIGERIAVRLTLLEEALGMTPGDPEIYGNWIASKAPEPENGAEEVVASRPKAKPMSVDGRTGFIFLNRDGLPRVGGDYDRVFRGLRRKYAKGGGVPLPEDMTPHTLRHTFCTEMAKAGMNPKALQYIMGHKDIKMTLGYYAHMDGCTAAEEMRRVAV